MAEEKAVCPGCDRADDTMTVRAGYQDGEGRAGAPPWHLLAPPPVSGPSPEPGPRWGYAVLAGLGGLGLLKVLLGVTAHGLPYGAGPYGTGALFGAALFPLVLLGVFGTRYAVVSARNEERLAAHRWETEHRRRRMAVWEAALLCRRCVVVFFPDGALRPDFPASPAIAPAQFPAMVATMAERAFGGAHMTAQVVARGSSKAPAG
ncbi:hypothetical protein [Kitasatospora sp. NBC_00315]|uniref:hypothetical protein n=1 Tax=Kitasatospora sp. NBC_00315 TaxID=2975963 RepID=UPI00324C5C66